jgi:hypothetical protein
VGGEFSSAGGKPSLGLARWDGAPDVLLLAEELSAVRQGSAVQLTWQLPDAVAAELEEVEVERRDGPSEYAVLGAPLSPSVMMRFDDAEVEPRSTQEYRLALVPHFGPAVFTDAVSSRPTIQTKRPASLLSAMQVDATHIRFVFSTSTPQTAVRLQIYNVRGQSIRELLNDHFAAGTHEAVWELLDAQGGSVSKGIYFVVLESGGEQTVRKVAVMH